MKILNLIPSNISAIVDIKTTEIIHTSIEQKTVAVANNALTQPVRDVIDNGLALSVIITSLYCISASFDPKISTIARMKLGWMGSITLIFGLYMISHTTIQSKSL